MGVLAGTPAAALNVHPAALTQPHHLLRLLPVTGAQRRHAAIEIRFTRLSPSRTYTATSPPAPSATVAQCKHAMAGLPRMFHSRSPSRPYSAASFNSCLLPDTDVQFDERMIHCPPAPSFLPQITPGAQCGHAAVGIIQKFQRKQEMLFRQWEYFGQAKIALKIQDEDEMVGVCRAMHPGAFLMTWHGSCGIIRCTNARRRKSWSRYGRGVVGAGACGRF